MMMENVLIFNIKITFRIVAMGDAIYVDFWHFLWWDYLPYEHIPIR